MQIFHALSSPGTEVVLRSLVTAATENPGIAARIRSSLSGQESVTGRLEAGIGTAPNLYPGAPFDEIAETLIGAVVLRALSQTRLGPRTQRGSSRQLSDQLPRHETACGPRSYRRDHITTSAF